MLKTNVIKSLIITTAVAPVLFMAFQNASAPDPCAGSALCNTIHRAMLAPRAANEGLDDAKLVDQAASRFGFGLSPLNNWLSGQDQGTTQVRQIARFLADSIDEPVGLVSANVWHLRSDFSYQLPASGIVINPTEMSLSDYYQLRRQITLMASETTDLDKRIQLVQDFSRARGTIWHAGTRYRLLMSAFNSQQRVGDRFLDKQVNLNDVLREFWYNHFNLDGRKAQSSSVLGAGSYERAINNNMRGTFAALLRSITLHPDMLEYLDNQSNRFILDSRTASNQNLGRELIELHTLGVGPGHFYNQDSVEGSALMLTGINTSFNASLTPNFGTRFHTHLHVPDYVKVGGADVQTAPVIMGNRFCLNTNVWGRSGNQPANCPKVPTPTDPNQRQQNMIRQLNNYISFLASHPRTRVNICDKLISRFITGRRVDDPDSSDPEKFIEVARSAVRERCIGAWGNQGDLTAMYKAIVTSPEIWSKFNYRTLLKNPHELILSGVRSMGYDIRHFRTYDVSTKTFTASIFNEVRILGLPYRSWQTPTGYKMHGVAWLSGGLMVRWLNSAFKISNLFEEATRSKRALPLQRLVPGRGLASSRELQYDQISNPLDQVLYLRDTLAQKDVHRDVGWVAGQIVRYSKDSSKSTTQYIDGVRTRVPLKTALNLKISNVHFLRK